MIAPIHQASLHPDSTAIIDGDTRYTYRELLDRSHRIAAHLLKDRQDLEEDRVAFMVEPGLEYVATLWGIWLAGGVAVPLCLSHPLPSLRYVMEDTGSTVVICSPAFTSLLQRLEIENKISITEVSKASSEVRDTWPEVSSSRRAMILYTSGTTNLPKGVVTTHSNLEAQISTLIQAWNWIEEDQILCVLPLHHVHGIVNVVCCSLWAGARCQFVKEFDPLQVFKIFQLGEVNVFMAVPTIYHKLMTAWDSLSSPDQRKISKCLVSFRLMVSGSAALPVSVMEKWKTISSHTLLERYGMTELGMAISNPYVGERKAGFVGLPLEGVSIRLVNDQGEPMDEGPGEIQVKGANVFLEYWNKPEATKSTFTDDGWFKTGDVAVKENGYYRILGRSSVDIIKSGGYKISALEIEEVLRQHPMIKDVAVVGLENEEWGEIVAAALVMHGNESIDTPALTAWMKEQIPPYRVPRKFLVIRELPRNAMGKVVKNDVKKLFVA